MRSFDVDEHHENVSEEHAVFAFDPDLLSQVFSKAVHEAFDCVFIILFAACVMSLLQFEVACRHASSSEERM